MTCQPTLSKALAAVITIGCVSVSFANETTGSAGITILESLAVTEQAPVDFGHVHRPSQGSNLLTLSYSGDSVSTNGDGDALTVDGTSSSGAYLIQGQPDQEIQMSVTITDFADPGISLQEAHIDGLTDTAGGFLDNQGAHAAGVGGVVSISFDASLGTHSTDVHVTVEYE